ncbi:MAG: OB-fold nucleic acid binding domain-containing protein [archaeon]
MDAQPRRQTAYKVWIRDLKNTKGNVDDTGLVYLPIKNKKVVRVNVIASIIDKFNSGNYMMLTVDDGSDSIQLKCWGEDAALLEGKEIGDMILVVGRLGEYQEEVYIRPEVIRKLDSYDWALLRRLELIKEYGVPEKKEKIEVVEKELKEEDEIEPSMAVREKVLSLIEKYDEAEEQKIIDESGIPKDQILKAVQELLKEGEVYMPRPGYLKMV